MDSDMAFLKNLEAFLDSSLINVASTESPFDTDDASLLLGTAESVNLSSALETDPITARTLPGLIASDNQTSSSPSDQECQNTKDALRAKETKRRQVYRQRLKEERETLFVEAGELSKKLQRLKKTTKKTTAHPELNMRPSKIWKNVAVAELEARERAEEEFQRLVAAVTAQAKLIDDLTRIMRKQIASVPVIHLEVNYTQIDKVFEDTNFVSNSQACQEMWSIAKQRTHADEVQVYNGGKDVRNIIAVRYRISKAQPSGQTASIRPILAIRRFVGVDNMVFVWKVLAEGEGFLRGIRADETGWCRVRPPTNPAEPGAWIELYARRTILHYTEGQLDAHTVGLFNDVLQCNLGEEQDEERAEGL
ncbi:hypothetical protein PC129_g13168 [Phytophthora cactorum]|uniref:Uncharacterized protein n=1 Tax=Phytophthora cactorum TaxID=29920 RepID=A0A8T1BPT6_9STRA|nr:hypothetical protein Pcac1_g1167 [Phytophthora cactorum]KAG2906410.1 hypothetical protein PC115_g14296 [Phytophthora cactorum]KAG3215957.1 hypothetical protein PC129_g13168 [Phytophthora cactorum]